MRGRRLIVAVCGLLLAAVAVLVVCANLGLIEIPTTAPGFDASAPADIAPAEGSDAPEQARPYTTWSKDEAPDYYRVVGKAVVDVELAPGEVIYSDLDDLGRTGRAVACVTLDMVTEGIERDREDVSSVHPSGWGHNAQVDIELADGSIYHGFLFNRSHLIAKSLGGADVLENLVCGTHTQNVGDGDPVGGMSYCEQVARDWLFHHRDGWVFYSATPIYEGDELLCRSVIVDMRSSDGSLDMRVEVYNAAWGYEIDYATGEFVPAG